MRSRGKEGLDTSKELLTCTHPSEPLGHARCALAIQHRWDPGEWGWSPWTDDVLQQPNFQPQISFLTFHHPCFSLSFGFTTCTVTNSPPNYGPPSRQCQENIKNNSSMLFCISQFPGLLLTVSVLNSWWRLVALDLAFSMEGVAISWQLPSVPALLTKGNWASARARSCSSWRQNSGRPSSSTSQRCWALLAPRSTNKLNLKTNYFSVRCLSLHCHTYTEVFATEIPDILI